MTATDDRTTAAPVTPPIADGVTLTIDGFQVTVPKGTLVIRAAEQLGIQIPRFCDHPLLDACDNIFGRSFCALGDAATSPVVSTLKYFRAEYIEHFTSGGCPFAEDVPILAGVSR